MALKFSSCLVLILLRRSPVNPMIERISYSPDKIPKKQMVFAIIRA